MALGQQCLDEAPAHLRHAHVKLGIVFEAERARGAFQVQAAPVEEHRRGSVEVRCEGQLESRVLAY